jgi:hypothetical protein
MPGAATLAGMSPKKRGGGKRRNGNPQRREQQLGSRNLAKAGQPGTPTWARELSTEDRRVFGDLARRLAGWEHKDAVLLEPGEGGEPFEGLRLVAQVSRLPVRSGRR